METRRKKGRRSGVFQPGGRAFAHLLPSSTLGSQATMTPGAAAAHGGFGAGIPAGGGGGIAAALAGSTPVGGPPGGLAVEPGIAPPPAPIAPPNITSQPAWPSLPGLPTLPEAPATGNIGTYPTQIGTMQVWPDPLQGVIPYGGVTRWPRSGGGSSKAQ
jgi:hypothetical protein